MSIALVSLAAALSCGCTILPGGRGGPPAPPEERAATWEVDHQAWSDIGYRLDWRGFPAVTGGRNPVEMVDIQDDLIVVLDQSGVVSALDASDGSTLWRLQLANPLTNFVGLGRAGDRVIAVSESDVYIIDPATGALLDRQDLDHIANTEPIISGDAVIFGTGRGEIYLHSLSARIPVWGNALWGRNLPGAIKAAPIMVAGVVGAVTQNGEVFFLDPSTGALVAANSIAGGMGSDPVAEGPVMYVASLDQSVYAFSAATGSELWRYRTGVPLRSQPAVHNQVLYVAIPTQGMTAFNAATGQVLWATEGVDGQVLFQSNGALVVWDGREIVRLDLGTGDVLARTRLEDVSMIAVSGFESPVVYAVSDRGVVGKFVPQ